MLGFARNIVFFRVNGASVAEKSWLACATGAGVIVLPSIPARFGGSVELQVPGDFFSCLLMLCYCVLHVLHTFVHWNCCIQAMCSTVVCCNSFVCLRLSVRRSQWNSCVNAVRKVPALQCCLAILIVFCKSC